MALINQNDRIFVAGHLGLVGSAITETLESKGYKNLILRSRSQLDLTDCKAVERFFQTEKPTVVFLAAAKVGGIVANQTHPTDFITQNLLIQTHVIQQAYQSNVHRFIFLGSACIYPRDAQQPMAETALLTGPLEMTNRGYSLSKIAGLETVDAYRREYGVDYFSVMPNNLYGPRDRFDTVQSHVIPALVSRFAKAVRDQEPTVTVWGTGKPLREFLYSLDCADAIVFLAEKLSKRDLENSFIGKAGWSHVNIGSGVEMSIKELAELIAEITEFKGKIFFDTSKPDGTPRKFLDISFLKSLGWKPKIDLKQGIKLTLQAYLNHTSQ